MNSKELNRLKLNLALIILAFSDKNENTEGRAVKIGLPVIKDRNKQGIT